jgi:hypothetical protein
VPTGANPRTKSERLDRERRYTLGKPPFRIEPIGLREDVRVVEHSPENSQVENKIKQMV